MALQKILDFIYPNFCLVCQKQIDAKSLACEKCLDKEKSPATIKFKINAETNLIVHSLFAYKKPFEKIIFSKFVENDSLFRTSGRLMAKRIKNLVNPDKNTILCPIPIHWMRRISRGFNQTESICSGIESDKNLQARTISLIKRQKNTKYQSSVSVKNKSDNLKNAFSGENLPANTITKQNNLIIIDDLCTTGATLVCATKELVKTFPELNGKTILAFVICRAI